MGPDEQSFRYEKVAEQSTTEALQTHGTEMQLLLVFQPKSERMDCSESVGALNDTSSRLHIVAKNEKRCVGVLRQILKPV